MKRKISSFPDLEPFFFNELEIIDRSKGIIDTKQITKEELLDEYKVITEAYMELLQQTKMLIKISDSNLRKLKKAHVRIEQANTELSEMNQVVFYQKESLEQLNNELSQANAAKDKFFSIIAHDLRGPLGTFNEMTAFLAENIYNLTEEDKVELLSAMSKTSHNVYSLLENLLQWARSQIGSLQFAPREIDICILFKEILHLFHKQADKKKISIEYKMIIGMKVYADSDMVKTILRNLISNALKFTPIGGKVRFKCTDMGNFMQISVADTGVGISQEDLKKLFRIDIKHTTLGTLKEKGTGLGLVLCKEFVETNGGQITAKSVPGKGSTFTFTLAKNKDMLTKK